MSDDIDRIKEELEEVRRLKESLRKEVEEVREEKERLRESGERRRHPRHERPPKKPLPPKKIGPPHPPRPYGATINLEGLTESLEEMMDGLGEQISASLKGIEGIEANLRFPQFKVKHRHKKSRRDIEKIPPERVAEVLSPLGSEERLKILDFLKDGGKSFNEMEAHTGKTGSSLTHHLNPLLDAGYIIKGQVRGTYYVTVVGRLAYRLAQWLTSRVEYQLTNGTRGKPEDEVGVEFDEGGFEDTTEPSDATSDNYPEEDDE
ncbi:ArsR family transcriptional regulator [Candidatus Thorarchaeota archaeon]|nr:MAG: ArsR family transcriptional regulator [Candidatus Thorarchaeota archaeon]